MSAAGACSHALQALVRPRFEVADIVRRFLQHVLPAGFHKVRYYGLWAPANRHRLRHCQVLLAADQPAAQGQSPEPDLDRRDGSTPEPGGGRTCPHCGKGILVCVGAIARQPRAPP